MKSLSGWVLGSPPPSATMDASAAIETVVTRLRGPSGRVEFIPHCVLEVDVEHFAAAGAQERRQIVTDQADVVVAATDDAETHRCVLECFLLLVSRESF